MRLAVFSPLAAADRGEACQAFAATGALLEECLDFGQLDGGYRALHECHYCDGLYHARCSEHRGDYHAGFSPGAAYAPGGRFAAPPPAQGEGGAWYSPWDEACVALCCGAARYGGGWPAASKSEKRRTV